MDKKVEELMEWVAKEIYRRHKLTGFACARPFEWDELLESTRTNILQGAKQILSHPDLALIDRETRVFYPAKQEQYRLEIVISLAEALKETK